MKTIINAFKLYLKYGGISSVICLILHLCGMGISLLQLYSLKWFIDSVSNFKSELYSCIVMLLLLLVSYLLGFGISYFSSIMGIKSDIKFSQKISSVLYTKSKKIAYSNYENESIIDIITRMGSDPQTGIKKAVFSCVNVLRITISTFLSAVVLFEISYMSGISFFFIVIIASVFSVYGIDMLNKLKKEQTKDERRFNYFNGILINKDSVLELRIFNSIEFILGKINSINSSLVKKLQNKSFRASFFYNISTVLITLWTVFAISQCYQGAVGQSVTIGSFAIIVKVVISLMDSIEQISYSFSGAVQDLEIINYFEDFIQIDEVSGNANILKQEKTIIHINNVEFKYPGMKQQVLKGINLSVKEKEKIAIVGDNGSGKSTLIKLICGLYNPDVGNVTLAENSISSVFQDYCKYNLTVRENVAIGDVKLIDSDDKINSSLYAAQFNFDEIDLDSNLGKIYDDGIDISGGQWQRLAIARALIGESDILILDEPTAAVDPIAEKELYEAFLRASNDKTCIIISHRLASARMADRIIVLKDGEIIEQGSHDELMKNRGEYYRMFNAQSSWYLKENKNEKF